MIMLLDTEKMFLRPFILTKLLENLFVIPLQSDFPRQLVDTLEVYMTSHVRLKLRTLQISPKNNRDEKEFGK